MKTLVSGLFLAMLLAGAAGCAEPADKPPVASEWCISPDPVTGEKRCFEDPEVAMFATLKLPQPTVAPLPPPNPGCCPDCCTKEELPPAEAQSIWPDWATKTLLNVWYGLAG